MTMTISKQVIIMLGVAALLAGCKSTGGTRPATANLPPRDLPAANVAVRPISAQGLEAVMGKDSAALTRLFGEPRLNVQEVNGRKLQFVGTACILDAYLYPEGTGGSEVVTHIDARRRDGAEVDRASCVNALAKR
jgi:hypothetical protein